MEHPVRTENDIHDALTRLADDSPDPDSVLAAVRRSDTRRRPRLVLAAAVATTIAAAVAVPVTADLVEPAADNPDTALRPTTPTTVRTQPTTAPPPTTSARTTPASWRYLSSVKIPAGFRPESSYLTSTRQRDTLTDLATTCEIDTYRAGALDPGRQQFEPSQDTVDGRPVQSLLSYDGTSPALKGRPKVAWQYAADAWATVACTPAGRGAPATRSLELELANSMTFEVRRMPVPFTLGTLPAGLSVQLAGPSAYPPLGVYNKFELQATRKPEVVEFTTRKLHTGPKMLITYSPGRLPGIFRIPAHEIASRRTINGRQVTVTRIMPRRNEVRLQILGKGFEVDVLVARQLFEDPHRELLRIAEDMKFAPRPTDQSTWYDGTTAIP
jgi:hypothetical protein